MLLLIAAIGSAAASLPPPEPDDPEFTDLRDRAYEAVEACLQNVPDLGGMVWVSVSQGELKVTGTPSFEPFRICVEQAWRAALSDRQLDPKTKGYEEYGRDWEAVPLLPEPDVLFAAWKPVALSKLSGEVEKGLRAPLAALLPADLEARDGCLEIALAGKNEPAVYAIYDWARPYEERINADEDTWEVGDGWALELRTWPRHSEWYEAGSRMELCLLSPVESALRGSKGLEELVGITTSGPVARAEWLTGADGMPVGELRACSDGITGVKEQEQVTQAVHRIASEVAPAVGSPTHLTLEVRPDGMGLTAAPSSKKALRRPGMCADVASCTREPPAWSPDLSGCAEDAHARLTLSWLPDGSFADLETHNMNAACARRALREMRLDKTEGGPCEAAWGFPRKTQEQVAHTDFPSFAPARSGVPVEDASLVPRPLHPIANMMIATHPEVGVFTGTQSDVSFFHWSYDLEAVKDLEVTSKYAADMMLDAHGGTLSSFHREPDELQVRELSTGEFEAHPVRGRPATQRLANPGFPLLAEAWAGGVLVRPRDGSDPLWTHRIQDRPHIAFNGNGELLAVLHFSGLLEILDTHTGEVLQRNETGMLHQRTRPTKDDPRPVALGWVGNTPWSGWTKDIVIEHSLPAQRHSIEGRVVSFDERGMLTAHDRNLQMWSLPEVEQLWTRSGGWWIGTQQRAGDRIFMWSMDATRLQAIDRRTGELLAERPARVASLRGLAVEGGDVVVGGSQLLRWRNDRMTKVAPDPRYIEFLATSGDCLVAASRRHGVAIYEHGSDTPTHIADLDDIWSIAGSRELIAVGRRRIVELYDHTGNLIRTFDGHDGVVTGVAFSPNGRWLATGSSDQTVAVWDVRSGKRIRRFVGHQREVRVDWMPDGRTVVSTSTDETIRLWPMGGAGRKVIPGAWSNHLDVDHRGRIAISDSGAAVWVFDKTGTRLVTLPHPATIQGLRWMEDGRLVTIADDGRIRVWRDEESVSEWFPLTRDQWISRTADGTWIDASDHGLGRLDAEGHFTPRLR